jgi:hypothetical protein
MPDTTDNVVPINNRPHLTGGGRKKVRVMSRKELSEELVAMKALMKQVIDSCNANLEGTKPTEMKVDTMRRELDARFKGLDQRLMKLEGR